MCDDLAFWLDVVSPQANNNISLSNSGGAMTLSTTTDAAWLVSTGTGRQLTGGAAWSIANDASKGHTLPSFVLSASLALNMTEMLSIPAGPGILTVAFGAAATVAALSRAPESYLQPLPFVGATLTMYSTSHHDIEYCSRCGACIQSINGKLLPSPNAAATPTASPIAATATCNCNGTLTYTLDITYYESVSGGDGSVTAMLTALGNGTGCGINDAVSVSESMLLGNATYLAGLPELSYGIAFNDTGAPVLAGGKREVVASIRSLSLVLGTNTSNVTSLQRTCPHVTSNGTAIIFADGGGVVAAVPLAIALPAAIAAAIVALLCCCCCWFFIVAARRRREKKKAVPTVVRLRPLSHARVSCLPVPDMAAAAAAAAVAAGGAGGGGGSSSATLEGTGSSASGHLGYAQGKASGAPSAAVSFVSSPSDAAGSTSVDVSAAVAAAGGVPPSTDAQGTGVGVHSPSGGDASVPLSGAANGHTPAALSKKAPPPTSASPKQKPRPGKSGDGSDWSLPMGEGVVPVSRKRPEVVNLRPIDGREAPQCVPMADPTAPAQEAPAPDTIVRDDIVDIGRDGGASTPPRSTRRSLYMHAASYLRPNTRKATKIAAEDDQLMLDHAYVYIGGTRVVKRTGFTFGTPPPSFVPTTPSPATARVTVVSPLSVARRNATSMPQLRGHNSINGSLSSTVVDRTVIFANPMLRASSTVKGTSH